MDDKEQQSSSRVIDLSGIKRQDRGLKRTSSDAVVTHKRPRILAPGDYIPYTATTFLTDADYYYNNNNLIQSSSKLWFAASYAVKLLFLRLKFWITSHKSLKLLCKYAIEKSSVYDKLGMDGDEARKKANEQFEEAEMFHKFSYGSKLAKGTFEDNKDDVFKFVNNFLEIKPEDVKPNLINFLRGSINFDNKSGDVKIGGTTYNYDHECW